MDSQTLREVATDAIRYWELRRLVYNALLVAIVLVCFWIYYPNSKAVLNIDAALIVFLLAVAANVAYCAIYIVDVFAQLSEFRPLWQKFRWIAFVVGASFAGIITRFFALGMFQQSPH
ncbi:MAG: hypothetical protein ACRD5M_03150 [Candidatus Acidiferrales bacterium]